MALYFRSNMLSVLGMLAFGWVLVYVTNNEAILFARSLVPVGSNNIDAATSIFLGFGPAVTALLLTRKSTKKTHLWIMGVLLTPAIVIVGWLIVQLAVSYETRNNLLASNINQTISTYQEYALWIAAIMISLILYYGRPKSSKEEEKKKK
ncbi:hypothetical protein KC878_02195 [Candidatus Saccharibacteria bacterium]|nr:hypothetical protein [Candidatus Saccharibacteria bacterium]MCB9820992.1 hypothetical protein [Candidatus Nomurabacteria bacterium]